MANGNRTGDPRGFNKGRSLKFHEGSRVRQTPEEGRRTYRPKRRGNNNKNEGNSPKNLNDKNIRFIAKNFKDQPFPTQKNLRKPFLKDCWECIF